MKTIDIFCASQASTAICLSTDQPSSSSISSSSNTTQYGGRTLDRHNPIITDPKRTPSRDFTAATSSSSSSPPPPPNADPKTPSHDPQKAKKNTIPKPGDKKKKKKATQGHDETEKKKKSEALAEKITEKFSITTNNYSCKPVDSVLRRSLAKPPSSDLITPPGSSRYLLSDSAASFDFDPVLALTTKVDKSKKAQFVVHEEETKHSSKRSGSSVPKSGSSDQVVVLRVSLHCKGCEGKVRKHLSKMQGVTSFNIDFAAKKVTVVGDVTPLSVLASISKVKTAKFWPLSAASPIGSADAAEVKKANLI